MASGQRRSFFRRASARAGRVFTPDMVRHRAIQHQKQFLACLTAYLCVACYRPAASLCCLCTCGCEATGAPLTPLLHLAQQPTAVISQVLTFHCYDHSFDYNAFRMSVPPCFSIDMVSW